MGAEGTLRVSALDLGVGSAIRATPPPGVLKQSCGLQRGLVGVGAWDQCCGCPTRVVDASAMRDSAVAICASRPCAACW